MGYRTNYLSGLSSQKVGSYSLGGITASSAQELVNKYNQHKGGGAYITPAGTVALRQPGSTGGSAGGNSYLDAYNQAKAANESRYAAIRGGADDTEGAMGGYLGRYGRGMGYIDSLSNQQEMDAREAGQSRMSSMNQDLTSRGLTGTTIKPTQEALINRETDANVRRIQDSANQQRIATDAKLSGDQLGFMERRTDAYPDMNLMASLYNQSGRYSSRTAGPTFGGSSSKSNLSGSLGSIGRLDNFVSDWGTGMSGTSGHVYQDGTSGGYGNTSASGRAPNNQIIGIGGSSGVAGTSTPNWWNQIGGYLR